MRRSLTSIPNFYLGLMLTIPLFYTLFFAISESAQWTALQVPLVEQNEIITSRVQPGEIRIGREDSSIAVSLKPVLIPALPSEAYISRLVLAPSGLYMLDANAGEVIYAREDESGQYHISSEFRCGPGHIGQYSITELVDIAAIESDSWWNLDPGVEIIGVDAHGTVIYCHPENGPFKGGSLMPPSSGLSEISRITVENDTLIVLNRQANQVLSYPLYNLFISSPDFIETISSSGVGINLESVTDMVFLNNHLYMMNSTGQIIDCLPKYFALSRSLCIFPAEYQFPSAQGRAIAIPRDVRFTRMVRSEAPRLLYTLNPNIQAVYQFSPELVFMSLIDFSQVAPGEKATAIAVSLDQELYIVIGRQVYTLWQ